MPARRVLLVSAICVVAFAVVYEMANAHGDVLTTSALSAIRGGTCACATTTDSGRCKDSWDTCKTCTEKYDGAPSGCPTIGYHWYWEASWECDVDISNPLWCEEHTGVKRNCNSLVDCQLNSNLFYGRRCVESKMPLGPWTKVCLASTDTDSKWQCRECYEGYIQPAHEVEWEYCH
jgi:hypothetical protein